jgi:CRISPR-associated endoribonuclease Cas6
VVVNRSDVAMENPRIDGGRMIRFGHIAAKIQDEKGNAVWLHPESSRFFQNVTANAIERYETLTGESYAGGLEIKPLRTNRKKIHHYQKNRIEVWGAEYEITGERKMLEFLDRTGIGANLAQGLGLLRGVKHG